MSKKSLSAVKAKSEELKIPYENLLSAFVIEEAVTAVCESDEAENFRLKNNSILSLEYYRRKAPTRLEYVILSEEELTVRNVIHRMSKIFQNEKKAELWWKYRVEKEDEGICVYVLKSHSDTEALAGYIVDTPAIGLNSFNIHFENTENCDFSDVIVAFMSKTGLPFFIDYVKITQDLKAGDKLEVPYSVTTTNNTTLDFTDLDSKFDYGVTVTASRNYNWVNYVSNVSARAIARTSTAAGINNVSSANDACAVGGEGQISITAPDSAVADIYTISGILIKSVKGSTSVDVNAGVYIVNISGKNFKLIVR